MFQITIDGAQDISSQNFQFPTQYDCASIRFQPILKATEMETKCSSQCAWFLSYLINRKCVVKT
jgi:hypothetical protein